MSSLDRILPFLRPIEDLLRDPSVTEVMVNDGGQTVFVERAGRVEALPDRSLEPRNLTMAIKNIARACGDETPTLSQFWTLGSRTVREWRPCSRPAPSTGRC